MYRSRLYRMRMNGQNLGKVDVIGMGKQLGELDSE